MFPNIDVKKVVNCVPAMLYVFTVNHDTGESGFQYVSDYCEKLFGYTAEFVSENPKILANSIHEDDVQQYTAAVVESMQNLTPFDRRGRVRRADGKVLYVHFKSMPRLDKEEAPDGTMSTVTVWDGIVMDVTKQVVNESNKLSLVKQMIDSSLQPIFEIDMTGNVSEWNRPMELATGYSRSEAVGKPVTHFCSEEDRGNLSAFVNNGVNSGEFFKAGETSSERDCVLLSRTRGDIYLHVKCTKSRDVNGVDSGLLCCCQDMTRIKTAERQTSEALELVDAERGLMEWLSHEVRNPLSVAMEAAHALREGAIIVEQNERGSYVELICESIHYIVDLLTNMLDLNKCLDGKIKLDPCPTKIREEVLVSTFNIMRLRGSKVEMRLLDGDEIVASVDPLRLRQVVTNLLSNAVKFTSEGFIEICLVRTRERRRDTLSIVVRDTGCGIKPSDYDVLFSKWERLGSQINGTGIGLCLCQSLVRAMGGEISINKEYNSGIDGHPGAEFTVQIPVGLSFVSNGSAATAFDSVVAAVAGVAEREEPEPESKTDEENVKLNNAVVRGGFRILIVDDDKVGRKLLRKRFARLFPDAVVDEVSSGEQAIDAASKTRYDIITMDHFMAVDDMNGEDTIKELRAKDVDALIVGISGNSMREAHLSAGAEDFFQKPMPSDDILLQRLLMVMAPPSGWKVLCVDDVQVNIHFLRRRLLRVAAPHFTTLQEAEKRWHITTRSNGEDAMEILKEEWFDFVVLDQHMGEGATGSTVASFVREHAVNKNAVIALNTGSLLHPPDGETAYNIFWPKPLPSTEQIRLDLCRELLSKRR